MRVIIRIFVSILLGLFILVLSGTIPELMLLGKSYLRFPVTHTVMLVLSLIFIYLFSKGKLSVYGLKMIEIKGLIQPFIVGSIAGFVLARISSFFTMKGFEFTKELSLTQVIIFIWIYASVSEEFLTRGLILGFLAPLSKRGIQIFKFRISVPVIVSALFFGFMHMGLITMGANTITMLIVILSAVILGIIAGYYREKTESIIPAIIIHMLFNVWGTIIG